MQRYGLIGGTQDDVLWLAKKSQAALPHIELRFGYEAGTAAVWMRPFNFESVRLRFHASDRRRLSSSLRRCLFDELQPELHGTPGSKFKRDVSVRKPAAAATSLGGDAHRASLCDPLLGCERDTVEASLNSAPVAFDGEIGKVSGANLSSTP